MDFSNSIALVTGGASGLGDAVARSIVESGGKVAILDLDQDKGRELADQLGSSAVFMKADVTSAESVSESVDAAVKLFGALNVVVNCAGIAPAAKVLGKKGPHDLALFNRVVAVNLVGTFNVIRLAAEKLAANEPGEDNERGVIINTASAAAFEGQIGQAAYSASKGGIVSMTLTIARELATLGIRIVTIAPGIMKTPMMMGMPDNVQESLGKMVPFPQRLGQPEEYASLVRQIVENRLINGTTIRLDGAIRMQSR